MSSTHIPRITSYYLDYLTTYNLSLFISRTCRYYTEETLCRSADSRDTDTRRAAALILGFVGTYASNNTLGKLLSDSDRSVRLLAESSIKNVWTRDGSEEQRHALYEIMRQVNLHNYREVIRLANILLEEKPLFAEARNQRAIALFALGDYHESIEDAAIVLDLNPYHFGAAIGMAHAYMQTGNKEIATLCFQHAVYINPNLETVKKQLQKMMVN